MLLTETGLNRLLDLLDADREAAGRKYERIHQKLVRFFVWQGCAAAEELADKSIDRVVHRLEQGEEIRAGDPAVYFYGVARFVAREWWTSQKEPPRPLARFAAEAELSPSQLDDAERRSRCLDQCLARLGAEARNLILQYYQAHGREGIENRQRLARQLQISPSALRLRARRIREHLETCVSDALGVRRHNVGSPDTTVQEERDDE